MGQVASGHASLHHLNGAFDGVHAAGPNVGLGRQLPLPMGPTFILSHTHPHLVHHGCLSHAGSAEWTVTLQQIRIYSEYL